MMHKIHREAMRYWAFEWRKDMQLGDLESAALDLKMAEYHRPKSVAGRGNPAEHRERERGQQTFFLSPYKH